MTDYFSLADAASEPRMSRVQVNQRALIDKILARYAAEYAVYRELLQNSNDADATTAEIHFTWRCATATMESPFDRKIGIDSKKLLQETPILTRLGPLEWARTQFSRCAKSRWLRAATKRFVSSGRATSCGRR